MTRFVLVLGLGLSGQASVSLLLQKGYRVIGVDDRIEKEKITSLVEKGMEYFRFFSVKKEELLFAVVSPGIPPSHSVYAELSMQGVPIVGEVALALSFLSNPAIAVTGTNGKTTVTLLVEHVLRSIGKKVKAVGNVGFPLSSYCLEADPEEILVVELSSYQLETLHAPYFLAATVLNITPDHLDRYSTMLEYAQAKARVQDCLLPQGKLFLSLQVERSYSCLFSHPFTILQDIQECDVSFLPAIHDRENALAAFALCQSFSVQAGQFLEALKSFRKPSHRMEFIGEYKGVCYIDDSKGTNLDAVIRAVESISSPIILIAGGVHKGASYLPWKESFGKKVKLMLVFGQSAGCIYEELALFFNVKIVDSLKEAVRIAKEVAKEGDVVLLSPGCSSFDMFQDYAHRGREFQKFVRMEEEA